MIAEVTVLLVFDNILVSGTFLQYCTKVLDLDFIGIGCIYAS